MTSRPIRQLALLAFVSSLIFATAVLYAQEPASAPSSSAQTQQQPENPNAAIGEELSKASHEAAESEEHGEHDKFKYSPTVQWMGRLLGMDPHRAYFVSLIINFGLLALFFYVLLRTKVPQMFRDRTDSIQKGIREAQQASAEATERLSAIEARLSKIDTEIGEIRAESDKQAASEEERLNAATEDDKQKVIESARTEIDSIARNARRDLKSYAASLAVDIAARKIRVDERSDQALVREFVDQLGKDGK